MLKKNQVKNTNPSIEKKGHNPPKTAKPKSKQK